MKSLLRIESFVNTTEKEKFCLNCGSSATEIACFQVEGATIIERYCKKCVKSIK